MTKADPKVARERLRRNLDEPNPKPATRPELFLAIYIQLDRAQLCADPVARLNDVRHHLDQLIAIYSQVRR
ncbi:MAG: hypothetical protein JWM53_6004 [bacterium]|nr:hypothetical protein [bacterium]